MNDLWNLLQLDFFDTQFLVFSLIWNLLLTVPLKCLFNKDMAIGWYKDFCYLPLPHF